ncbi:MAG: hypothetical protein R6U15_04260 [Candidatus Izemoplasmatales bacterium]
MSNQNQTNETNYNTLLEALTNSSFSLEKLVEIINDLIKQKAYIKALKILNFYKKKANLSKQKDQLKLHNLYLDILLITEDFESLLNVLISREKYLIKPKDFLYQKFYLAICYEGLNKYKQAIDILETIPENISSKNLTNKYLKLSLLYLEIDKFQKAKESYQLAKQFDREKQNEMFILVESDLDYYQENYLDSLKKFEKFFLITKRKYAYLNRFIKINLKLNRLDEAYNFYCNYKEKIQKQDSLNNQISFFKSALPLLTKVDKSEYQKANNYLSNLLAEKTIEIDDFNDYNLVLKNIKRNKIYYKSREIIRDLFIDLNKTNLFEKLIYLKIIDGKIKLLHFSKELLLEKDIETNNSIFSDIINNEFSNTYKTLDLQDFIFVTKNTDYILVEKIVDQEFLLTYINDKNFAQAKKITILSSYLIKNNLNDFKIKAENNKFIVNYSKLLTNSKIALLKIVNNYIYFVNDYAKVLFNQNDRFIKFSLFQKQLEKIVYLDELLKTNELLITYNNKQINLLIQKHDYELYILAKEKPTKTKSLKFDELTQDKQKSLVLISINNYLEYINNYSYKQFQAIKKALVELIYDQSNNHIINLIDTCDSMIYLHLDTIDKRVVKRIASEIINKYLELDLRVVYSKFDKPIKQTDEELKNLLAFTSKKSPIVMTNKDFKLETEKDNFYLELTKKFINENKIKLKYNLIKNWETNKISFLELDIFELELLADKDRLKSIISKHKLGILFDRLIVNQFISELKKTSIKSSFIIPITYETINSKKAFNYLLKRIETDKINQIIFKIDFQTYLNLPNDLKKYLIEKNIIFCFENVFYNFDFKTIKYLTSAKYIIINNNEYNHKYFIEFSEIIYNNEIKIIYDHKHEKLIKSDLKTKNINYIKGEFAGEIKKLSLD